jgi:hypothetical protein
LLFNKELNKMDIADKANLRANLYSLLMRMFGNIPDESLLAEITGPMFQVLLKQIAQMVPTLKPVVDNIGSFIAKNELSPRPETIRTLYSDRVSIVTGLSILETNSPANYLTADKNNRSSINLNVTYFPLSAEEIPDEKISNLLDNLCIELDYMSFLCRQEQKRWAFENGFLKIISQEADFLREDLGIKASRFTSEATLDRKSVV